jgi:RNA polymerase sigma-70 factor (ECF subfamily)
MTTLYPSFEGDLLACRDALHRTARRLFRNRDDADDAVQTVFLRALEHHAQFTGSCLSCWLHRILTNLFYSRKRDAKRLVFTGDSTYADHLVDQSNPQARLEARETLAAIATRPDSNILMQAGVGVSNDNLAQQFGMRPAAVRKALSRGRKAIKEAA